MKTDKKIKSREFMKKAVTLLLALGMIFSLSACSTKEMPDELLTGSTINDELVWNLEQTDDVGYFNVKFSAWDSHTRLYAHVIIEYRGLDEKEETTTGKAPVMITKGEKKTYRRREDPAKTYSCYTLSDPTVYNVKLIENAQITEYTLPRSELMQMIYDLRDKATELGWTGSLPLTKYETQEILGEYNPKEYYYYNDISTYYVDNRTFRQMFMFFPKPDVYRASYFAWRSIDDATEDKPFSYDLYIYDRQGNVTLRQFGLDYDTVMSIVCG